MFRSATSEMKVGFWGWLLVTLLLCDGSYSLDESNNSSTENIRVLEEETDRKQQSGGEEIMLIMDLKSAIEYVGDGVTQTAQQVRKMNTELKILQAELQQVRYDVTSLSQQLREGMKMLMREAGYSLVRLEETLPQRVKEIMENETNDSLKEIVGAYANRVMSSCEGSQNQLMESVYLGMRNASELFLGAEKRIKEEVKAGLESATSFMDKACNINVDQTGNVTRQMESDIQLIKGFTVPSSCDEVRGQGATRSGVYTIFLAGKKVQVYCDLETDGGGWTVFQRRSDDVTRHVDFNKGWADYKRGFGNLAEEFWLGLDTIHALTPSAAYVLRVDLEDWEGEKTFAVYNTFRVRGEEDRYLLLVDGFKEGRGGAGDSLSYHSAEEFTTRDRDNDGWFDGNCAHRHHGGWWYDSCYEANLNGPYQRRGRNESGSGVYWKSWRGLGYSLRKVEMKVRPRPSKI